MADRGTTMAALVSAGLLGAAGLLSTAALLAAAGSGPRESGATGVASGADGSSQQNSATPVTDEHGSVQAIRGIKGIDQVQLQNLEAVLRMQSPPQQSQQSNAKKAAALMTMDMPPPEEPLEMPDAREEHAEFELEGS